MPAWPIFLYTNLTLCKYLLLGLFEYQQTGLYPNRWAAHEECSNMLIMVLGYTQRSSDQSFISTYTQLLEKLTDCLVQGALGLLVQALKLTLHGDRSPSPLPMLHRSSSQPPPTIISRSPTATRRAGV